MSNRLALIIEDDYDLSTIFDEALKAAEYKTEVIRDGDTAMARLAVVKPDVVILDLHLPHVAGTDILDYLCEQKDKKLSHARVIVTTADARLAETLHSKADLVLVKPISFSQLRDMAVRLGKM